MPGPPPKRKAERRRRNKDGGEVESVDLSQVLEHEVEIPVADPDWHPVALQWYESLAKSGQALYYEPSDWGTAYLIAESLSRDLEEQVVGITEAGDKVYAEIPMKGASLSAYLKAMTALMVTEGDRRKSRLEIERANAKSEAEKMAKSDPDVVLDRAERFRRDA